MRRFAVATFLALLLTGCASAPHDPPATLTDEHYVQLGIDQAWEQYTSAWGSDEVRPDVDIERTIQQSDWAPVMVECLHDEGFVDVALGDDGTFSLTSDNSQLQPYDLATYVCSARFPLSANVYRPFNEKQLDFLYSYYVDDLVSCLEVEGYAVEGVPSRQAFFENPGGWAPYSGIPYTGDAEWKRINEACPQSPGDEIYELE